MITWDFNIISKYFNKQWELPLKSLWQHKGIIIILTVRLWELTSSISICWRTTGFYRFSRPLTSKDRYLTLECLLIRPVPTPVKYCAHCTFTKCSISSAFTDNVRVTRIKIKYMEVFYKPNFLIEIWGKDIKYTDGYIVMSRQWKYLRILVKVYVK